MHVTIPAKIVQELEIDPGDIVSITIAEKKAKVKEFKVTDSNESFTLKAIGMRQKYFVNAIFVGEQTCLNSACA